MKVSRKWLNNFFSEEIPPPKELANTLTFHVFEIEGIFANDVLDVKVTPNRGHDCLSHRGVAKELSAILKLAIKPDVDPLGAGFKQRFEQAPTTDIVSVTLEDPSLSPRYIAAHIKGVKVAPSPDWLRESLEAVGQRSINNVVDATNLVMFNIGQPLHAFDAGKLQMKDDKYHIVVRKARAGEKLNALDGKEYELEDRMLVIADGNKDEPIGVAGVKGGMPAAITEETTDIILESANFNGVSVRKTSQALKLRTDASARFEQVISPELASYGMQNAIELIRAIAGGELAGVVDVYPSPQQETRVAVTVDKINKVLGTNLTSADVASVFLRLGFAYKEEGGSFEIVVPFERLDLTIPEDLVEEVGRIVGYEKIPTTALSTLSGKPEINKNYFSSEKVREELQAQGYSEVFTSVFADKGEKAVLNKVDSVKPYLRDSLLTGLQEALKKNISNKDLLGVPEVKLFEVGTVWKGGREVVMVGTISEKEKAAEKELEQVNATEYETLPLSTAQRYSAFSKFPYIVRDIAMWVPSGTDADALKNEIKQEAGELYIKISLFDRFEKGEKTSLAFRLIFQSFERTLTESEVNSVMEKIYESLRARGFEIR
jgi:phenylalanyl-tRNA synthetase beta chain